MDFFFNELSIHDQFQSRAEFKTAVSQFRKYRDAVTGADFRFYIHRNILKRRVVGNSFRSGIQACFNRQQVRTLMNWFNKDGSFLPDDAYSAAEDRFTCYFPGVSEEASRNVTGTALAECAFRKMSGENTYLTSLEPSEYNWIPIRVSMELFGDTVIENDYTEQLLTRRLARLLPAISSWPVLLDRIELLPGVILETEVMEKLRANPFARNIAEGLYVCAIALSEMATAPSLEQFNELYAKYATGMNARFSDSSAGEKRKFKENLTFKVDNEPCLCSYHGKVKIQQYRMHLEKKPVFQNPARIVYIGPKLTKV